MWLAKGLHPIDRMHLDLAHLRPLPHGQFDIRVGVRPWLGLSSSERGGHVEIVRVDRSGPALEAGLRPGDVVLEIDGVQVTTLEAFYKQLWKRPDADADVELTVRQGSEVRKIKVHAVDRMQTLRKPQGI